MDLNRQIQNKKTKIKTNKHPNFSVQAYSGDFDSCLLVDLNHNLIIRSLSGFMLNRVIPSDINVENNESSYVLFVFVIQLLIKVTRQLDWRASPSV